MVGPEEGDVGEGRREVFKDGLGSFTKFWRVVGSVYLLLELFSPLTKGG